MLYLYKLDITWMNSRAIYKLRYSVDIYEISIVDM